MNLEKEHVLLIEQWFEDVRYGCFIDRDGFGTTIIWDGVSEEYKVVNEWVYPSEADTVEKEVTHIIWYNN
jgi:hypothetical protein